MGPPIADGKTSEASAAGVLAVAAPLVTFNGGGNGALTTGAGRTSEPVGSEVLFGALGDAGTIAESGCTAPGASSTAFCSSRGLAPLASEIVGARPAYLTFDIDCLDPAFAPGTGTPVAGGLSSAQALAMRAAVERQPLALAVPVRLVVLP